MKNNWIILGLCLALGACATPQTVEQHRQTCLSYGHADGSPELAACVERKAQAGSAAANKVGTSVLTKAVLGAI